MDISDIKPYEKNAKKHPDSQLKALARIVAEVGWRQNVLINHKTLVIIAGHGRLAAFLKYREEYKLPEIWITNDIGETVHGELDRRPLTEEQEKAYRLADNKLNESDWEMGLVMEELKGLTPEMLDLTGFDRDLIIEPDDKDDLVPELPEEPKSRLGDIYQLGKHRIMCGDSTDDKSVEKLMNGQNADCVFTDPPYNINYKGQGKNTSNTILQDNMLSDDFTAFLDKVFANYSVHAKAGAGVYVFHASRTQSQFEQAMTANGYEIKNQLIWNKPMSALGWGDYRWKHEPFFYAGKKGSQIQFYGDRTHSTVWDFQKTDQQLLNWARKQKKAEAQGKTTIWSMKRDNVQHYLHPTQKPVELVQYAIINSTKQGDLVMDLFLGGGSTIIACEKTARTCYGMELDPKYIDVIIQRWEDYTGQKAVHIV